MLAARVAAARSWLVLAGVLGLSQIEAGRGRGSLGYSTIFVTSIFLNVVSQYDLLWPSTKQVGVQIVVSYIRTSYQVPELQETRREMAVQTSKSAEGKIVRT